MKRKLLLAVLVCALSSFAQNPEVCGTPGSIAPNQAIKYVGGSHEKTVCGKVAAVRQTAKATFVDFGHPFPDQNFTIVIWSDDRDKFGTMPTEGVCVCVSGLITEYKHRSQIILKDPAKWKIKHAIK